MSNKGLIRATILIGVFVLVVTVAAYGASGDVWMEPASISTGAGSAFAAEVYADTGAEKLGAYQFTVKFDPSIISIDTSMGNKGVEAGSGGFVAAVNPDNDSGTLVVNGFDLAGRGPGTKLQVFIVHFKALKQGKGLISISIKNLTNERGKAIGVPAGGNAAVEIW